MTTNQGLEGEGDGIAGIGIAGGEVDIDAGRILGESLKHNDVLTALNLSDNYAHDGAGFAEGFSQGLSVNKTITELKAIAVTAISGSRCSPNGM